MAKELHDHPLTEEREGIPKNKVLIDREFKYLFKHAEVYWDRSHVVVDRDEYNNIKKTSK